jgi:hypothetical protein
MSSSSVATTIDVDEQIRNWHSAHGELMMPTTDDALDGAREIREMLERWGLNIWPSPAYVESGLDLESLKKVNLSLAHNLAWGEQVEDWLDANTEPVIDPKTVTAINETAQAAMHTPKAIRDDAGAIIAHELFTRVLWEKHQVFSAQSLYLRPKRGLAIPEYVWRYYGMPAPGTGGELGRERYRHPTIHAFGPVSTGMEGIWRWADGAGIIRDKSRPPHVTTPNGGMVSVGGDSAMVMDEGQEAAAFAAGLELSDDTAAAFVLGLARWCERGNRRDRRSYVVVTVDEYCQARGWKKHHKGGYKPEHKARARDEMMALNKVWVRHQVPDHLVTSDGTRYVEGPLMTVSRGSSDRSGRNTTGFRMSPGTWANDFLEDNPNCTALVLENVLRLDTRSRSGQIAQRLGLYMALQWRTKFLNNNVGQSHRIATLLAAVGIDPKAVTNREERRRIRTYLTVEGGALDQLQAVGAIGTRDDAGMLVDDWRYKNEEAGNPFADASWDAWLEWTVFIPAPRDVSDFYEVPQIARQDALKEGMARKRRRERATDAAKAKHAAEQG